MFASRDIHATGNNDQHRLLQPRARRAPCLEISRLDRRIELIDTCPRHGAASKFFVLKATAQKQVVPACTQRDLIERALDLGTEVTLFSSQSLVANSRTTSIPDSTVPYESATRPLNHSLSSVQFSRLKFDPRSSINIRSRRSYQ